MKNTTKNSENNIGFIQGTSDLNSFIEDMELKGKIKDQRLCLSKKISKKFLSDMKYVLNASVENGFFKRRDRLSGGLHNVLTGKDVRRMKRVVFAAFLLLMEKKVPEKDKNDLKDLLRQDMSCRYYVIDFFLTRVQLTKEKIDCMNFLSAISLLIGDEKHNDREKREYKTLTINLSHAFNRKNSEVLLKNMKEMLLEPQSTTELKEKIAMLSRFFSRSGKRVLEFPGNDELKEDLFKTMGFNMVRIEEEAKLDEELFKEIWF